MNEIDFKKIGYKLKSIRISKGLTQEYVAEKANVNTSHISNIENNRVKISLTTLIRFCNALDITIDYILADEYNDSSSILDQEIQKELKNCDRKTKENILKIIKILK